jgi:cytochrome c peroxidase
MKIKSSVLSIFTAVLAAVVILSYTSCKPDRVLKFGELNLPESPYDYLNIKTAFGTENLASRIHTPRISNSYLNNQAALGRVLFYDTKLSINNSVSCGSCHKQKLGFADGSKLSTGFANKKTLRNTLSIINTLDESGLFWDSRADNATELSLMPVFDHREMGMENDEMLVEKIGSATYYSDLFQEAYGSQEVTKERITIALSTFLNTMFSKSSRFDGDKTDFNFEERLGMEIFNGKANCVTCHTLGANFSNGGGYNNHFSPVTGTANIGLDKVYADKGVGGGSFRIPSLRNVELTGPYMHDGRYTSLGEVINHYNGGVQDNKEVDPVFRAEDGKIKGLGLSNVEKEALISFLKTLTDNKFISDPKFSDPFN